MGRRPGRLKARGLFYFADTCGIPLDIALRHLRSRGLTEAKLRRLVREFIGDAMRAGWPDRKIKSDLREADRCGHLHLDAWVPKLYHD